MSKTNLKYLFSVCTKVLGDVMAEIPAADAKNADKIAAKIRENCKVSKGKDNKFVS